VFWTAALALAAVTGVFVGTAMRAAEDRAAQFGAIRRVPVARRPIAAGAIVRAADVVDRDMPAAFVPAGGAARSPVGRTAIVAVSVGEVILASKVAPEGLRGVAALLRSGERALAVPVGPGTPPLTVGDLVDVLATPPDTGATLVAARATRVVGVDDRAVTLAVHPADAAAVAAAVAAATVTLALAAP
jgi:Flp pilus assembly protein CpaB